MSKATAERIDPLKELEEIGEHPQSWKPEPGDVITGVIRRYDEVDHPENGHSYIAIIQDTPSSVKSVWISSTVLRTEFAKKKPAVGEQVSIRYLGKPQGKRYHKFTVMLPGRPDSGVSVNWNKMDPDQESHNDSRPAEQPSSTPYAAATVKGNPGTAVSERPAVLQPTLDDDEDPFAGE